MALCFLAGTLAQAQGSLSGLPLDNFQFKASHNAFEKDETMDDQIDNYNSWCIELDLRRDTGCGLGINVYHPAGGRDLCLDEAIQEILRANDLGQRITFIWLDVTAGPASDWPVNRRELIRNGLLTLGPESIYAKSEFDFDFAANGRRWPSWQDLHARGKRFILVLEDGHDASGRADDPLFFIAVSSYQEAMNPQYLHATFININDADTGQGIPEPNDRWIYRAWFGPLTHDPTTWEMAASRGFNLINTDDINQGYTITDSRTHSPQPFYVDVVSYDPNRLWGTRNYPMNQITSAVSRATPGITMRVRPGNYPGSYVFNKPMIIEKDSHYVGPVVIGGE